MSSHTADHPVVVIGAGPVGLVAAAHLYDRGLAPLVFEAGSQVGAAIREWAHVRTFTPWRYIVDPVAEKLLAPTGWTRPDDDEIPTGGELVGRYLEPLAAVPQLRDRIMLGSGVVAVTRAGIDKTRTIDRERHPLLVRIADREGAVREVRASAVLDASGTWRRRNPLGGSGLPAIGEEELAAAGYVSGPLPDVLGADRDRFAGKRTLVVGAGHSAANTLLLLAELADSATGTEVLWAVRAASPSRVYGGGDDDQLPARGQLGTDLRALVEAGRIRLFAGFTITQLRHTGNGVSVVGVGPDGPAAVEGIDRIVAATGFRPDLDVLAEVRLDLDPGLEAPRALAPLIDPNFHSCGTVRPHGHRELAQPEPGLYVVGMKSYGRAPTFLITTGNEQVRSVAAALAGDLAAADEVQLVLPETGVCSARPPDSTRVEGSAPGACCG